MGLWKHSFRKAFSALVVVLALLVVFLVILQASESLRKTSENAGFSTIKSQESNVQREFSLPEVRVEVVHGSEGFTLRDLNIQVSDENQ